jgi:hypothetical protein
VKTQGVGIEGGYLILRFPYAVPEAFWGRLRHHLAKARLLEEFEADLRRERDAVKPLPEADQMRSEWTIANADREERLFRRWVERVCGPQERWPWERGWTEEGVDAFLRQPVPAREAA